jgi:hypothetical protein
MISLAIFIAFLLSATQDNITVRHDASGVHISGWSEAARFQGQLADVIDVYVDSAVADVPPISGQRSIQGEELLFVPRYGLQQGTRYRVVIKIPGRAAVSKIFETPKADLTPTTRVEHIYPSAALLPENQLKFYIHFSAPMSRGEAYRRIHLMDEAGTAVKMPFLELEQELWDLPAQRLTLFFDPGRIKREVLPNQELGPPIEAGHNYTLVVDQEWLDADGKRLVAAARKPFAVGAADRRPLDVQSWKMTGPASASTNPLAVDFPEPLDHALMLRQLEVIDAAGNPVEGRMETERDEQRWIFTPASPWKAGAYRLRVGTNIADLAGNMIDRPFEIDRFDSVTEKITRETRTIPFTVK